MTKAREYAARYAGRFLEFLCLRVLLPFIRWVGRDLPQVQGIRASIDQAAATALWYKAAAYERAEQLAYSMLADPAAGLPVDYVAPVDNINPLVLMAAFQDYCTLRSDDPEGSQAMLNACMFALRGSNQISGAAVQMLGAMLAAGYPPEEALLQVQANAVYLGMFLERRLAGGPPPLPDSSGDPLSY